MSGPIDLEREFEATCRIAIDECRSLTPSYIPTIWIGMINNVGAVVAARKLLVTGEIQEGFTRLIVEGRPELTVEWEVLQPKWAPLFDDQILEAARWRLRQAKVEPPF